jgi:hypothetical protein
MTLAEFDAGADRTCTAATGDTARATASVVHFSIFNLQFAICNFFVTTN